MGVGPLPPVLSFILTSAGSGPGSCCPLIFGLRLWGGLSRLRGCSYRREAVTAKWSRHWRRDGHPQVGDSAEAAAGGGPEPVSGEGPLAVEFGLEARVLVRGWVSG